MSLPGVLKRVDSYSILNSWSLLTLRTARFHTLGVQEFKGRLKSQRVSEACLSPHSDAVVDMFEAPKSGPPSVRFEAIDAYHGVGQGPTPAGSWGLKGEGLGNGSNILLTGMHLS